MSAYYNEFDPFAAAWLRELIKAGHIAPGDVDERSITEVKADDIRGYTQCHFFAGIGGWSLALRLAGWDDDRPVWTGSCPCQPFSTAGQQKGHSDERHLWPHWARLIGECRPPVIFGEQVASAITYGWWDDVATDLEAENYACAAAVLPACSVGKPHKRDRLWFVANSESIRSGGASGTGGETAWRSTGNNSNQLGGTSIECGTMGNAQHDGRDRGQVAGSDDPSIQYDAQGPNCASQLAGAGEPIDVADTERLGRQGQGTMGEPICSASSSDRQADRAFDDSAGLQWIACPDGKQRPVEPSICLLAHGIPNRVGKLRGYGNAIVPQVAAEFIKAAM